MSNSKTINDIARLKVGIILKRLEFVAEMLRPCADENLTHAPRQAHDANGVHCMAEQLLQCISDLVEVFDTEAGKNHIAAEGLSIANL